jgi:hypothetical protein
MSDGEMDVGDEVDAVVARLEVSHSSAIKNQTDASMFVQKRRRFGLLYCSALRTKEAICFPITT